MRASHLCSRRLVHHVPHLRLCKYFSTTNSAVPSERAVLKFGGSSVGSVEAFKRSGAIISAANRSGGYTAVVISAMLGVTNRLLDVARLSASGDVSGASQRVRSLLDSHIQVTRALCSPLAASKCAEALSLDTSVAEESCAVLAKSAAIGAKARTEGQFAADAIATLGERWASRIMASHLKDDGLDAVFVNSKDVIVTDGIPNNSQPLLKESHAQSQRFISPLLNRGAVPIITGFYGASRNGQITTLGRGGSD